MKPIHRSCLLILLVFLVRCEPPPESRTFPAPGMPSSRIETREWPEFDSQDKYYDKVLGSLVGSAIGDAMGAPVEMWSRRAMDVRYGYIDTLLRVSREASPEGPWEDDLPGGSTTDDTRWKYLMGYFLLSQSGGDSLSTHDFSAYIMDLYAAEVKEVKSVESLMPEQIERQLTHMTWLQEWAKVSRAYLNNDLDGYSRAVNRFYGGEMACGGMLYAPMIGLIYPGHAARAYTESYRLGLFDLGYARDITGLTAAYVARAMDPEATLEDILAVTQEVDPLRYGNSRLIGRLAQQHHLAVKEIMYDVNKVKVVPPDIEVPRNYFRGPLRYTQLQKAYSLLDQRLQQIPFHAGEIHLINLAALEFAQGDFREAMEFIVNYGRDNDTVAAVTGAILGAYLGYNNLPQGLAESVLKTSREVLGMDLEELAQALASGYFQEKIN